MANDLIIYSSIRVVSKSNYDQQWFFELTESDVKPLAPHSVRVKPCLVGLGSNNLSYCAAGDALHWWDAYPLPQALPAPYNNGQEYGVPPGWGYATVLETTITIIAPGTLIWGFFPIAPMVVDLRLEPSTETSTQWLEISPHRGQVMPLYQRYFIVDEDAFGSDNRVTAAWTSTLIPVWEAAYVLNRFCYPSWTGDDRIHPIPDWQQPWSETQADLRSSLVIALGAGTKTSRSFVHQLATNRATGSGPKAVMEVTSTEDSFLQALQLEFAHKVVTYSNSISSETISWIKQQVVKRVVMFDFGSRDNTVRKMTGHLREVLDTVQIDVISIGGEAKVLTTADKKARIETVQELNATRMNTSAIRAVAIQQLGEQPYFNQLNEQFHKVVQSELGRTGKSVLGIKLVVQSQLKGTEGLEQAWKDLCQGHIAGSEGLAFDFD